MKKVFTILLISICLILSGCGSFKGIEIDETGRDELVYTLTRARYDGDIEKMYENIPDIFLSDEMKHRYIDRINRQGCAYNNIIGIRDFEYEIINAAERKAIFNKIANLYGINEFIEDDVQYAGYFTLNIVEHDVKGKLKSTYNKNVMFKYQGNWYMILLEEKKDND